MREEVSPINSDAGTAVQLSRKFERSMSNDSVHERMPQDPDAGFFVAVANKTMTLPTEPVVAKSKKRRKKSEDVPNKVPRRRSLRLQMKESLCDGGGVILPSVDDNLDDNCAAGKHVVEEYQMKVTHDGSLALAETLANVAMDLVGSVSSSEDQDVPPATTTKYLVDDEGSERNTIRVRKKAKVIRSVLESLEPVEKENSLNCEKNYHKKRRDTFDLSRSRGLTRSGAVQSNDDGLEHNNSYAASEEVNLQIDTDIAADLKPPAPAIISAADKANKTWTDMITPKNGSNEVPLPKHFGHEISNSLIDEPDEIRGSPAVKENMRNATSVAIEEQMRSIFSEFSVYNYVSFFYFIWSSIILLSMCSRTSYCLASAMCIGKDICSDEHRL